MRIAGGCGDDREPARFRKSNDTEARGKELLNRLAAKQRTGLCLKFIRPATKDSCLLELQTKCDVDYFYWDGRGEYGGVDAPTFTLELKAEERHTGNLTWETDSNLGVKPGWGMTSKADFFAFAFLDREIVYIVHAPTIRAYVQAHAHHLPVKMRHNQSETGEKLNTARFFLVPVGGTNGLQEFARRIGKPIRTLTVGEGESRKAA